MDKSNTDLLMDQTTLARDRGALAQIRAGITIMREAYGDTDELEALADAFDAFEQSRELDGQQDEANRLDAEAEAAFKARFERDAQASYVEGTVWALRSLTIPSHPDAVIAYARRNDDGTWELFPLPPKTRFGGFA
jgi:hypothetical protein